MENKKTIYRFDALKIYNLGLKDKNNKKIICDAASTNYSKMEIEKYRDSLLFDQLDQVLDNDDLYCENIIVIDFSNFLDEYKSVFKKFIDYEEGIELVVNDKKITFIPFIKSNSMSRESKTYYINKELYDVIKDRITFGFENESLDISKWFSYSGLMATDCKLIELKLNENNVCIIPDLTKEIKSSVITAVSINSLLDDISNLQSTLKLNIEANGESEYDKLLKDIKNVRNLINKFDSYRNSIDFPHLQYTNDLILNLSNLKNDNVKIALEKILFYKEKYKKTNPVRWEKINIDDAYVQTNVFDGTGLIDSEYMDIINKKLGNNYNSIQIRLPFTKGMLHNVNLKEFFEENGIEELDSIINFKSFNRYETKKIAASDVKIILTVSQFKAAKFLQFLDQNIIKEYNCDNQIEYYFKKLNEYKYKFGIANVEFKKKDYPLNYEFLSTLPLLKANLDELCFNTIEIIKKNISEEYLLKSVENNEEYKGDILIHEFARDFYVATDRYKRLRDNTYYKYLKDALACKVYTKSERRYLAPDLLSLMYYSFEWNLKKDNYHYEVNKLKLNTIYLPQYNDQESDCLILRNPHYSRNEIAIHKILKDIDTTRGKYLSHLSGVIMSNYENLLSDRLGGADYDGDSVLILTDNSLVSTITKQFLKLDNDRIKNIYPIAKIPSLSSPKQKLNYKTTIDCFDKTFNNNIGRISNIAVTRSIDVYDSASVMNGNLDNKYRQEFDDIAFYTILNGLEIDSVKNGFKPYFDNIKDKYKYLNVKEELDMTESFDFIDKYKKNKLFTSNENHPTFYIYNKILDGSKKLNFDSLDKSNLALAKSKYKFETKDKESLVTAKALVDSIITKNKYISARLSYFIKNQNELYISMINSILSANNNLIDINKLIEKIKNNNPRDLLSKYINIYKDYIFLIEKEDKIRFINNLGINNLDDNEIDALTNFNNRGYNLLFLFLELSISLIDDDKLFEYLINKYELKEEDNNIDYIKIHNDIIDHVIDYSLNLSKDELKKDTDSYLRRYIMNHYNIDFEALANVIDVYKYDLIFTMFFDSTYQYFKKSGDKHE